MVKTYVLDTNILLSDPAAMIRGFDDNEVVICSTVIQELDKKKRNSELSYYARESGRILDDLRQKGNLLEGVKNEAGGITRIEPDGIDQANLPLGFSLDSPDNRIISACIHIGKQNRDRLRQTVFVTDDIIMRISATAAFAYAGVDIGIQGYRNIEVSESDAVYNGWCTLNVYKKDIDRLYKDRTISFDELHPKKDSAELNDFLHPTVNEFFTLKNDQQSALTVYRNGCLKLIDPRQTACGWVKPKNSLQSYALWLLREPSIPLKILIGNPGTGKTFLSLAAGLDSTIDKKHSQYEKMLISRPVTGFEQLGFLPGDVDSKLYHLYESFYDNIEILLKQGEKEDREQIKTQMEDLFSTDTIEVTALSFIRGRSLMNSYLIADEVQNASQTLVRDIITRAGENSAVVIMGDPHQIDVSGLSSKSNGLVYAAARMKGSPLCGIIRFPASSSVRSPLAKAAAERM